MADHSSPDPITCLLGAYEKALKRLKRDRTLIERAPKTFGELAARVEAEIERRSGVDRRAVVRGPIERRATLQSDEPPAPRPFSGAHLQNRD